MSGSQKWTLACRKQRSKVKFLSKRLTTVHENPFVTSATILHPPVDPGCVTPQKTNRIVLFSTPPKKPSVPTDPTFVLTLSFDDYDNDEAIDEDETQSRVSHKLYAHSIVFF